MQFADENEYGTEGKTMNNQDTLGTSKFVKHHREVCHLKIRQLRSLPKPTSSPLGRHEVNTATDNLRSNPYEIYPELLPCPFCGSEDLSLDNLIDDDDFGVECNSCQIQQIANYTRDEAVRRWNVRPKAPNPTPVSVGGEDAISLVQQERLRQIEIEGWSTEHDDEHIMGEMIGAAVTYAAHALEIVSDHELPGADNEGWWPWEEKWWKPSPDPIRNLVKSAALIVAEIERLQRAKGTHDTPK
jgi:Lar family restriction alleviation protein